MAATSESGGDEPEICRYCLQAADAEEGGSMMQPCACRTPVHQRCLREWLFQNNRGDAGQCEVCRQVWTGHLSVSVDDVVARLGPAQQGVPHETVLEVIAIVRGYTALSILQEQLARRVAEHERAAAEQERDRMTNKANHQARRLMKQQATIDGLRQELDEARQGASQQPGAPPGQQAPPWRLLPQAGQRQEAAAKRKPVLVVAAVLGCLLYALGARNNSNPIQRKAKGHCE